MTSETTKKPEPDWPLWAPMAVFMVFVTIPGLVDQRLFPYAYVARTIVCGAMIVWLWKRFTDIRWTHLGLGVLVGVVGLVQWVGMECLLVKLVGEQGYSFGPIQLVSNIREHFEYEEMAARAHPAWFWSFLLIRFLGPVLVVPVVEELFWRNWLWRTLASPNDIRLMKVGEYDPISVYVVAVLFAFVHVQFLTAIVWALLIAWLLWKTKSLGACIVAHAVTNLLLGMWVLATWKFPGDWVPFGIPHWFFW